MSVTDREEFQILTESFNKNFNSKNEMQQFLEGFKKKKLDITCSFQKYIFEARILPQITIFL